MAFKCKKVPAELKLKVPAELKLKVPAEQKMSRVKKGMFCRFCSFDVWTLKG